MNTDLTILMLIALVIGLTIALIPYIINDIEEKRGSIKRCEVCGKPLKLTKEKLRIVTVSETSGLEVLVRGDRFAAYETFICDQCGCENVIKKMVGGIDFAKGKDDCEDVEEDG